MLMLGSDTVIWHGCCTGDGLTSIRNVTLWHYHPWAQSPVGCVVKYYWAHLEGCTLQSQYMRQWPAESWHGSTGSQTVEHRCRNHYTVRAMRSTRSCSELSETYQRKKTLIYYWALMISTPIIIQLKSLKLLYQQSDTGITVTFETTSDVIVFSQEQILSFGYNEQHVIVAQFIR